MNMNRRIRVRDIKEVSAPRVARRGFSLIAVLVLSIIGMSLTAAMLHIATSSSGAGMVSSQKNARYNLLVDGAEMGKGKLKKLMDNDTAPPRYFTGKAEPTDAIKSPDDLLVKVNDYSVFIGRGVAVSEDLSRTELRRYGINADRASLCVRVYDMQYSPELVQASPDAAMPPSVRLNTTAPPQKGPVSSIEEGNGSGAASNAGAYLIRATLEIGGRRTVLETAVIQSNTA
jgi:type II secretory pathway pseudopilin PulG